MTVDASNGPHRQAHSLGRWNRVSLRWKPRLVVWLVLAIACHQSNDFGILPAPGPRGVVVAPVRDYPFGDAVDVYRAALDMLYLDGDERPSIIVMPDSLEILPGCYVAKCSRVWPGKSVVDTSTYPAFLSGPRVQPRIRNFGYRIPIHLQSHREQLAILNAGVSFDSAHPPLPGKMAEGPNGGFRRHYPGAWGVAAFSLVGFNPTHTEAILQVRQGCGAQCYSDELVFFRRAGDKWRPVERLAQTVMADWIQTRLRYRGPLVKNPGESQLLVDKAGAPLRTEGQDAPSIYRLVVDSLYSFHGGHPRMIVVSGQHARAEDGLLSYKHQVDSSTRAAFRFVSSITDRMHPAFSPRLPMVEMTKDSMEAFEREGIPLQKEAQAKFQDYDSSPFWLAFRKHYPLAWGYVELSRIGFNPEHTQALVYATHWCGDGCMSGDVWFLTRSGEQWTIAENVTRYGDPTWSRDSLRYIGRGADLKNYQPRRAQGVALNFETGAALPDFEITFAGASYLKTVRTDAVGHFVLDDLPFESSIFFRTLCPVPGRSEKAAGEYLPMTHPGMDTTVNVHVPFRACTHLNRANPLIAGAPHPSISPEGTRLPENIAGVYAGVLDALYPADAPTRVPILLEPFDTRRCDYCIEPEVPRLVRKGLMDPSTEDNFAKARFDTATAVFPYRRKIEAMPMWDLYWLGVANGRDWTAMKDAYPGINSVISFAKVGFNSRGTQALVELHVDSAGAEATSETMVLRKIGADWHVALRHVEREATSGEWTGGKCEAGDAPAVAPTRAEIEKLAGEFKIVRVGASRVFRGRIDTVRVRLDSLKASRGNPKELVANADMLNATGEPDRKVAGSFNFAHDATTIAFRQHPMVLDGWYEEYQILRTDAQGFVGTWLTENGPTVPWRGYFCVRSARAR
jgi:hypothetical protein